MQLFAKYNAYSQEGGWVGRWGRGRRSWGGGGSWRGMGGGDSPLRSYVECWYYHQPCRSVGPQSSTKLIPPTHLQYTYTEVIIYCVQTSSTVQYRHTVHRIYVSTPTVHTSLLRWSVVTTVSLLLLWSNVICVTFQTIKYSLVGQWTNSQIKKKSYGNVNVLNFTFYLDTVGAVAFGKF